MNLEDILFNVAGAMAVGREMDPIWTGIQLTIHSFD